MVLKGKINKETQIKRKKHILERNFFLSTAFAENLLEGDAQSSVTMDRHVQLASAYSLEAWCRALAGSAAPFCICQLTWDIVASNSHFLTTDWFSCCTGDKIGLDSTCRCPFSSFMLYFPIVSCIAVCLSIGDFIISSLKFDSFFKYSTFSLTLFRMAGGGGQKGLLLPVFPL